MFADYVHPQSNKLISNISLRLRYGKVWISYLPVDEEHPNSETETSTMQKRSYYLCPCIRDDEICGFERPNNNSSLQTHICKLLVPPGRTVVTYFTANVAYQTQTHATTLTPMNSRAINLFLRFFCGSGVSFLLLSSVEFNLYSQGLISLGQEHPTVPTTQLMPLLTRHKIPKILAASAQPLLTNLLTQLRGSTICLMFDSGSINHHSYLAVCFCTLNATSSPQFLQLSYSPATKKQYGQFLEQVHEQLNAWNIRVVSICTDGLSAQVEGIKDFCTLVRKSDTVKGFTQDLVPFHIPCFNHRVNNVLKRTISMNAELQQIVDDLKAFSKTARTRQIYDILRKLCPTFVDTRWLCLSLMCSYVRMKRKDISAHKYLTEAQITGIIKLEILLLPLLELHLYFESHKTKLGYVYPALLRAILQYQKMMQTEGFNTGESLHEIVDCMVNLYNYCLSEETAHLVEVAFSVTPFGRIFCQNKNLAMAFNPDQSLSASVELLSDAFAPIPSGNWKSAFVPVVVAEELRRSSSSSSSSSSAATPASSLFSSSLFPATGHSPELSVFPQPPSAQSRPPPTSARTLSVPSSPLGTPVIPADDEVLVTVEEEEEEESPPTQFFLHLPPVPQSLRSTNIFNEEPGVLNVTARRLPQRPTVQEKALMSLDDLLFLYKESVQTTSTFCAEEPGYDDMDAYGTLAAEQNAINDLYQAEDLYEPIPVRTQPRRQTTTTTSSSSSTEEEGQLEEDDDEVILLSSDGRLVHPDYVDDASERAKAAEVIGSLSTVSPTMVRDHFIEHLKRILPEKRQKEMLSVHGINYEIWMSDPVNNLIRIPDLESSLLFCEGLVFAVPEFKEIVKALALSECSESESERVFSRVGIICGDKKTNILIQTLNNRLIIFYYSKE